MDRRASILAAIGSGFDQAGLIFLEVKRHPATGGDRLKCLGLQGIEPHIEPVNLANFPTPKPARPTPRRII